jgi:hypothetical protein
MHRRASLLVTVVKGGVVYQTAEVYRRLGIGP